MANTRLYQLNHCSYRCGFHLVWIPKYRGKTMADKFIKAELLRIFKQICKWKHLQFYAQHIGDDHVHLYVGIPPKYSVSYIVGILKGKSSFWLKKKTKKILPGSFWGKGYYVSTVGLDEVVVKRYVENQQHHQIEMPKLPL